MKQQGRAISSISFPKGAPAPQTISAELPKAGQCPAELLCPTVGVLMHRNACSVLLVQRGSTAVSGRGC